MHCRAISPRQLIKEDNMSIDDEMQDFPQNESSLGEGEQGHQEKGKLPEVTSPKVVIRPGRVNGKNSKYRSGATPVPKRVHNQIITIWQENRDKAATKDKKVGAETQAKRKTDIMNFFSDLFFLSLRIQSVYNLKVKHLHAVFNMLEREKQAPSTIRSKISAMRIFCEWIGKHGMVKESSNYVLDKTSVKVSVVAQEDKSWSAHEVDPIEILKKIRAYKNGREEIVAIWLEQCWAFGIRIQESVMFQPYVSDQGEVCYVREGAKGGRDRFVKVRNDLQRLVLNKAKLHADGKSGHLGKRGQSVKQKTDHFGYILERVGITFAEEGVTAHGLRHEFAQQMHKLLTGCDAPIKGGNISTVPKFQYNIATRIIMEELGHGRLVAAASYYGTRRRRGKQLTELASDTQDPQQKKEGDT
jgi:site-specific recombinase XerD